MVSDPQSWIRAQEEKTTLITDTIVAQATASGRGSVGILRISGLQSAQIALSVLHRRPKPRYAHYLPFYDQNQQVIDQGIALFFPQPHSLTGEDVLELQGHGGSIVLDQLLKTILEHPGTRIARPGEFSERAFLNGKIDLLQAEAVADLIDAHSQQAARCALHSLQGGVSKHIALLSANLLQLRTVVEALLDFPEETPDLLTENRIEATLEQLLKALDILYSSAHQGAILREGRKIVLAGRPNAGKSSLMNALTNRESAIVTAIPGTTRDVLHEQIVIDGIPFQIIDTAGLRQTDNEIECIGIDRAWQQIEQADHLLLVVDSTTTDALTPEQLWPATLPPLPQHLKVTIIRNKIDLSGEPMQLTSVQGYSLIHLCAHTRESIALLRHHLKTCTGLQHPEEGIFLARRRHLKALQEAEVHLKNSHQQLLTGPSLELVAESLRLAQQALGTITGQVTSDDLLGEIFSHFCIGK